MKTKEWQAGFGWRKGLILFSFTALVAAWTGWAGSDEAESAAFLNTDERNQFALHEGSEVYNAGAYQKMAKDIQDFVQNDRSFSKRAGQIRVFVWEGVITLRGEVENSTERHTILQYSREVVGMARIENQLEVR